MPEPKRLGEYSPEFIKSELELIDRVVAERTPTGMQRLKPPEDPISEIALVDRVLAEKRAAASVAKERGTLGEFIAGAGRGALGVAATPAYLAEVAGEAVGWEGLEKVGEAGAEAVEKYIEESPRLRRTESISRNILTSPELWTNPRWYASIVGEGLPTILSMLVPGMAAGKIAQAAKLTEKGVRAARVVGGLGAGMALEAGGSAADIKQYEEQTGEKVPTSTKLQSVLGTGIVAGSLEYVPIFAIFGKTGAKKIISRVLSGMATEGTTEGAQELVANAFAKAGYDADRNMVDGVVESIVGGVLLGGGMGAVSRATNFQERVEETSPDEIANILEQAEKEAGVKPKDIRPEPTLAEKRQAEIERAFEAKRTPEERQAAIEAAIPATPMTTISEETTHLAEEGIRPAPAVVEEAAPEIIPTEEPLPEKELTAEERKEILMRTFGMRPKEGTPSQVEKAVAPKAEKKEPEIEIPELTDTTQAIEFGKQASPEQITELKRLRKESEALHADMIERGDIRESMDVAFKAQLYREAFEAKEKPAEIKPPEVSKEIPPAGEIKKIGQEQGVMGVDAIVAETQEKDGVIYELYKAKNEKDKSGILRIYDLESGEIVGIKKYPTIEQAKVEYDKSLGAVPAKPQPPKAGAKPSLEAVKPTKKVAPIPGVAPKKAKAKEIGRNEKGREIFEEDSGQRYFLEGNVKIETPRGILPTGQPLPPKTPKQLFDEKRLDYLTKEEIAGFEKLEKPEKLTKPEKKVILKKEPAPKLAAEMTAEEMMAEWNKQAEKIEPTAKEKIAETKEHLSKATDAFKAINEILGEKGAISDEVDEAKWLKIKPLLKTAFDEIVAAGKSGAEFVAIAIKSLSPKGKPYFEKFVNEEMGKEAADVTDYLGRRKPREAKKADDKRRLGMEVAGVVPKAEKREVSEPVRKRPGKAVVPVVPSGVVKGVLQKPKPEEKPNSAGSRTGDVAKKNLGRDPGNVSGLQQSDYIIKPGSLKREGSWRDAANNNLDAIELLKKINEEKRPATFKEQQILAKYVGWGASELANNMFPGYSAQGKIYPEWADRWEPQVKRLVKVLTPAEIKTAAKSTQYAHYTNEPIINSIYKAMGKMGFAGGRILEPGMGIGNFVGLLPSDMRDASNYTGIEMDEISAGIARLLYPNQNMMHDDFVAQSLPKNFFDAAFGNPPFGAIKILGDPEYRKYRFSLHNFFFAKSIDRVRPGGLLVFVTSRYTMDAREDKARKYIADRADLLGAIRLPQTAFLESAGTEVVTDVLFLQKREEGIKPGGEAWTGQKEVKIGDGNALISEYFAANPEMVLGEHSLEGKMYGAGQYTVKPFEGKIETLFAHAAKNLPTDIYKNIKDSTSSTYKEQAVIERDFDPKNKKEGGIYTSDAGNVMKVDFGSGVSIDKIHKVTPATKTLLKGYVKLRDALKLSHKAQLEDGDWGTALKNLNKEYGAFVKKHGNILAYTVTERTKKNEDGTTEKVEYRRYKNDSILNLDCEASLVRTLESIDEDGDIVKSKVLLGRTINKPTAPKIETVPDALAVSLNSIGRLDIAHVAKTAQKSEEEVISTLGNLIYKNPDGSGQVLADEYLSGNVVRKLDEARFAAKTNPDFERNVSALEKVQPEPLEPKHITVTPGATWVPLEYYNSFAAEVLELRDTTISYQPIDNSWKVEGRYYSPQGLRGEVSDWSTEDRGANEILDAVLNNRTIRITYTVEENGKRRTVFDAEATAAANNIAKIIRSRFNSWVWEEKERAKTLLDIYNTKINVIKGREFDGSHLTLPGMSEHFKPYDYQKRVVWRILQTGNTYMAHAVGAGKTFIMISAGMEMRRLGMINKPLYVVPKHMLGQFAQEFQELYPMANVLVADEKNFHTENRRRFMAQATLNDPDAIILTHSSFGMIGVRAETLAPVREDFLEQMRYALSEMKKEGEPKLKIKRMEKRIEQAEQRFNSLISSGDRAISFEEFGADYLFVDECFTYDTLIETDIGLIRIGDIVEKKLQVNIKSWNFGTHVVEWKPVINWYRKYPKTNLIEVYHEKGSFICTTNHKIWTESGYKEADSLTVGEKLFIVREGIYSEMHREKGKEGKVLFDDMQGYSGDDYESMLGVQTGILFQDKGACEQCQKNVLFDNMPDATQGKRRNTNEGMEAEDATSMGQPSHKGKEISGNICSDEDKQSDVQKRDTRKSKQVSGGQKISCEEGREREASANASKKTGGYNRVADGIRYQDKADKREDRKIAEQLQGGFGFSTIHDSDRDRRIQPQVIDSTAERQQERSCLVPTRMVGTKILERKSDGEYHFCGRNHKIVYDIEVEGNHNYFANGVLVSNCHEFRKLDFTTNRQIKGIDPQGSKRAIDLYIKTLWLERQHEGRSHSFASGTPVVNTIGELYTLQRFFDKGEMEEDGINHFDAWANMFGEPATSYEMDASGQYAPVERFSKFVNIPELMSRIRMFMDVLTSSQLGTRIPRPKVKGGAPEIVLAPKNAAMEKYQQEALIPRIEASRAWKPSIGQPGNPDPIINIITDGRLASIDMRFVDKGAGNDPDSKLNKYIDGIIETYFSTKDMTFATSYDSGEKAPISGGAQICFYNSGFGKGVIERRGFNSKAFLMKRFKEAGIPKEEIAWIDDYKTAVQKQAVFKLIRSGAKRILLGSAKRMGTGVNVQNRLTDLHYLDAPWYPADVEQPDGRIIRQGNQNKEVSIKRYATKGSYDATLWQMVSRKSKFIDQAFTGDENVRSIEDISEASQYEMAAALASGDERVVQLASLRADIERLYLLEGAHRKNQQKLELRKPQLESRLSSYKSRAREYKAAEPSFPEFIGPTIDAKIGKTKFTERKEFGAALIDQIKELFAKESKEYVKVGTVNGIDIKSSPIGEQIKRLELEISVGDFNSVVDNTFMSLEQWSDSDAVGLTKKITNTINGLTSQKGEIKQALEETEKKLSRVEKKVGVPFEHAQELMEKASEAAILEQEIAGEGVTEEEMQAAARTQREEAEKAFYIYSVKKKYIKIKAEHAAKLLTPEKIGVSWAKTFFIHKSLDYKIEPGWVISDRQTGLQAGSGKTKTAAIETLQRSLATITEERFNEIVKTHIEKFGKPGEGEVPGFMKRKTATAYGKSKAVGLQSKVDLVTALWDNAPDVKVVQSQKDLPKNILEYSKGEIVDAVYFRGKVYIVADNIASPEKAVQALLHESFGHYGLRGVLGKDFGNIMNDVYASKEAEVQTVADEYGFDTRTIKGRALAAEEWLAREAVNRPTSSFVEKVMAAIRRFVRHIMPSLKLSDAEVLQLLQDARSFVERGRPGKGAGLFGEPGYQIGAYHGSPYLFDKFKTAKMGTGEGFQAIAWGLYFTDLKDIAKDYARRISGQAATSQGRQLYKVSLHKGKAPSEYDFLRWDKFVTPETKAKVLKQLEKEFPKDAKTMISWEMSYGEGKKGLTGQSLYHQLIQEIAGVQNRAAGFEKVRPSDKEASLFLLRAGIDGVKYPAGTISGIKTRAFDYVVFDEKAVTIDERIAFAKRKPAAAEKKGKEMAEIFKVLGIKPKLKAEEPLPKRARSVGLAYQDISEEAKRLEVEIGLEYPKITETHAELEERAGRIMADQEQLIKVLEKEKNWSKEEGLVVRKAAVSGLETLIKVVATKDVEKAVAMHKGFKEGIGHKLQDLHSEYGKNLESLKHKVSLESIAKAFAGLERDLNKEDMGRFNSAAEALGQGDAKPMISFQKYMKATKADPKIMDYVYEYWYNSILSGLPTQVVNVASNTAWATWQIGVHKPLLAALDPLVARFQKRPTEYYMAEIIPALAGIKRGFKPGAKGAKELLFKGYTTDAMTDKFAAEMGASVGAFSRSPNKHLREVAPFLTIPTKSLRGMDIWAKTMNYEAELGSIAKRMEKQGLGKYEELLKNPTEDMMNQAAHYADYTTFMDKLGKIGTMIESLRGAVPGGRFIVPFVRTIANLVKRGVEMTPGVGAMKLLGGKVKGKEVTQVLVKQIEGAMIALIVASMFDDDEITGDTPANKAEREAFYRQGKKPWSIKIGDTWYQYRRIEPFNTPIAAVGILYDTWKRTGEEPSTEFAYRSAAGFVNNIIDSSYLSGLTQVLDSVRKADKWPQKLNNMFDRQIASFSPMSSFQRSFVRAIEAIDKEGAVLRKPKGAIETLAAATPFWSKEIAARKNVWGEEVIIEGSPLAQWLPWKAAKATKDVVEKEIERLHGTGMSYPGMPAKYMSVAGKRLDLDDEQYDRLITESGRASKKKLDKLVGTSYWKMLSDKEKASRVQRIVRSNRKKVRNTIKRNLRVGAIPGMVPWKTKGKKQPAWQKSSFGKKAGWQKPMGF